MIVRAWEAIWLDPFATVFFNVCSDVAVECCVLYSCFVGVCCYVRKMLFSSVFAITERRDIDLYEGPLYVFGGLWDGDYVSQLPYVWYYVVVNSSLNMLASQM